MTTRVIRPTDFWSFICQPQKWEIDKFFENDITKDTYQIDDWQRDWFDEGQFGIIRVSKDKRTKKELNGRKRLESGIYAIVKILGKPYKRGDNKSQYWTNEENINPNRYIVEIEYIKKFNKNPILIEDIKNIQD